MANPSGLITGLENIAQVNNAYVVATWPLSPASDNVASYEVRWYRTLGEASGTATADDATHLSDTTKTWGVSVYAGYYALMGGAYAKVLDNTASQLTLAGWTDVNGTTVSTPAVGTYTLLHYYSTQTAYDQVKIAGLSQGTSYTFNLRAINNIGQVSGWSPDKQITTASDAAAPATPTGLVAVKTPRGALVSWNGNTEADLAGYQLQVSVGGGAYTLVTPGVQLGTTLAYVAPSGTATGTALLFQVRAVDWSGNQSAWSSASASTPTDGVVFDELLAGNLSVFGNLTTGGWQSAAVVDSTHRGWKQDATSLRAYDGSGTNYGAPSGAGVTVEITASGQGFFQGTVNASTINSPLIQSSSSVGTPGNPGFRLGSVGNSQFLDFYTIGSVVQGERYYYSPDNSSAFILAGVMAAGTMTFAKGAADSDQASISSTGGPQIENVLDIATFKAATTIARVGALGAFTAANGGSITPAYGQATTAGHLLIAWVACNSATPASITSSTSGWVAAVSGNATHAETAIWYKANCGAGEAAPTFTATLVAPSTADTNTETISSAASVATNWTHQVSASFSPAVSTTPITLVKAGAFTTGSTTSASPAFGQPTTSGNLLVALVSGNQGSGSGGTANIGDTGGTSTYDISYSGGPNPVFMGPYTMPQHGTITQLSVAMGADSGSVTTSLCLWNSAGTLVAIGSGVSYGVGVALRTQGISSIDAPSGSQWYIGMYCDNAAAKRWGVLSGTGNFKYLTNQPNANSIVGYTNGDFGAIGRMQAYAQYTIVNPVSAITTGATGWIKAIGDVFNLGETQIWYKANCGAAETAPVFTSTYGTETMYAQLAEYAGATASPLDKTGANNMGAGVTSWTPGNGSADTQAGDLFVSATRWVLNSSATSSWTEAGNNAVTSQLGNSGASSTGRHASFIYGIVPVPTMHAQVAEFSGAAAASPLDKVGAISGSGTSLVANASATDTGSGNLIVTAGRWKQTANSTASWTDSYNNATAVSAGNSGSTSTSEHSNFAYGIIVGASSTGEVLQLTNFVGLEAVTGSNSLGRGLVTTQYSSDAFGASFSARKSRGSFGSPATIANADNVGSYYASAYDGTNWLNVGRLSFDVNGTVSAGVIPTDLNIKLNPGSGEFTALALNATTKSATFAGTVFDDRNRYYCSVNITNAAQSIPYNTSTPINFDIVRFDPNSNFTTGTAAHYTVPKTGRYRIYLSVVYTDAAAFQFIFGNLELDTGSGYAALWGFPGSSSTANTNAPGNSSSVMMQLTAGYKIRFTTLHAKSGAVAASLHGATTCEVEYLGT